MEGEKEVSEDLCDSENAGSSNFVALAALDIIIRIIHCPPPMLRKSTFVSSGGTRTQQAFFLCGYPSTGTKVPLTTLLLVGWFPVEEGLGDDRNIEHECSSTSQDITWKESDTEL